MTPAQFINSMDFAEIVAFFGNMIQLFPPLVTAILFWCPAIAMVFTLIRSLRDAFKG